MELVEDKVYPRGKVCKGKVKDAISEIVTLDCRPLPDTERHYNNQRPDEGGSIWASTPLAIYRPPSPAGGDGGHGDDHEPDHH